MTTETTPRALPDSPALLKLMDRLHTELKDADIEASPVVSFTAESEIGNEPE